MKQLVFNFPDQRHPVICLYYGDLTEDSFKAVTDHDVLADVFGSLFGLVSDRVHFDKYFNNTPFIDAEDFDVFFKAVVFKVDSFSYYPNLLVCTFKSNDYGTEEEESQA